MPIKRIINKTEYEALTDASVKAIYVPLEGVADSYIIDDGEGSIEGLKSMGVKERTDRQKIEKQLKSLGIPEADIEALAGAFTGMDAATIKKLIQDNKEKANKELEAKGNYEAMLKQVTDGHTAKEQAWESERTAMSQALEDALIDGAIAAECLKPEIKGRAHLLTPLLKSSKMVRLEKDETTGKYAQRTYGADNNPLVDNTGKPLSVGGLLAKLRTDTNYAPLFEVSAAGGGGAGGQNGSKLNQTTGAIQVSREEIRKNAGAYAAAQEQAAKSNTTVEIVGE